MKHSFIVPLCMVSLLLSCNQNNEKVYHYEEYGLNCPVKSIKVTTYEAESKFGDIVKGELEWDGHYLAKFNSVGNIELIQEFDDEGDLTEVVKYKYDECNNATGIYTYNEDGECKLSFINEYKGGHLVKQTFTNYYKSDVETTITEFIREGERVIETKAFVNNRLSSSTKYSKHDKSGSEWITYDENGQEISKGVQKLNNKGRIKEHCDNDNCHEITWNEKNLPIHLVNAFPYHNTMISWYVQEESSEYSIEYEYDDKGNWVKQIVFECDGDFKTPITISERYITY